MPCYFCECNREACLLKGSIDEADYKAASEEGLWLQHADCKYQCRDDEVLVRTVGVFEFRRDEFYKTI